MQGKIAFGQICEVVEATIDAHTLQQSPSLDDLLEADQEARRAANVKLSQL
jgi:1-deoxy-D-xylulose 5-phosphate reductoisomerase